MTFHVSDTEFCANDDGNDNFQLIGKKLVDLSSIAGRIKIYLMYY